MPYIDRVDREPIQANAHELGSNIWTVGELNYAISCLVHYYLGCNGPPRYKDFNEVVGVLECVKLELYRDVIGPYEQKKKEENGAIP